MSKSSHFSKERNVYWSEEFQDVVNLLTGKDDDEETISTSIYQFNTGAMTLAAAMGVKHGRKRELGAGRRKEISTVTFASHRLESYIFLIPLLGNNGDVEILRPENEEELIREFERYAAGGFEVLRGIFDESAGKNPEVVLQSLMGSARNSNNVLSPLPSLFS